MMSRSRATFSLRAATRSRSSMITSRRGMVAAPPMTVARSPGALGASAGTAPPRGGARPPPADDRRQEPRRFGGIGGGVRGPDRPWVGLDVHQPAVDLGAGRMATDGVD